MTVMCKQMFCVLHMHSFMLTGKFCIHLHLALCVAVGLACGRWTVQVGFHHTNSLHSSLPSNIPSTQAHESASDTAAMFTCLHMIRCKWNVSYRFPGEKVYGLDTPQVT